MIGWASGILIRKKRSYQFFGLSPWLEILSRIWSEKKTWIETFGLICQCYVSWHKSSRREVWIHLMTLRGTKYASSLSRRLLSPVGNAFSFAWYFTARTGVKIVVSKIFAHLVILTLGIFQSLIENERSTVSPQWFFISSRIWSGKSEWKLWA